MSLSLFSDSMKLSMAPTPGPGPRCRGAALLPLRFQPVEQKVGGGVMSAWERPWAAGSGPQPPSGEEEMVAHSRAVLLGGVLPCGHPALPPLGHVRTGDPAGRLRCRGLGGEDGQARPLGLCALVQSSQRGRSLKLAASARRRGHHSTCDVRSRAPSWRHPRPHSRGREPRCGHTGRPPAGRARPRCAEPDARRGAAGSGLSGRWSASDRGHRGDGDPPAFPCGLGPFLCLFDAHDTFTCS